MNRIIAIYSADGELTEVTSGSPPAGGIYQNRWIGYQRQITLEEARRLEGEKNALLAEDRRRHTG